MLGSGDENPAENPGGWKWLLIGLIALHLIPVWSFRYFPSQDGPAHVENSQIFQRLLLHRSREFSQWYQFNHRPVPNLLGHVIMGGLMAIHLPPALAEKVVISLFVVGFPFSVFYAAEGLRRGAGWVGILSLPFVYSLALHKGLYNFCLSWPLLFCMIGYWARRRGTMNAKNAAGLAGLALLTYFAHVMSLTVGLIVLAGLIAANSVADYQIGATREQRIGVLWRAFLSYFALLPAAALMAYYFASQPNEGTFDPTPFHVLLPKLLSLDALFTFHALEGRLALAFSILLGVSLLLLLGVKISRRQFDRWDVLLVLVGIVIVLYFRTPNRSSRGGSQISFRLSMYPYLLLLLWFATQARSWNQYLKWSVVTLAAGLSVGLVSLHWMDYRKAAQLMTEFASVEPHLRPGETVLQFCFNASDYDLRARMLSENSRPMLHAIGYLAAERGIIDLDNYEAELNYFPVQYRNDFGPTEILQNSQNDLKQLEQAAGARVDCVLVWQTRKPKFHANLDHLNQQLQRDYELAYTSPHAMAMLYRRKRLKMSQSTDANASSRRTPFHRIAELLHARPLTFVILISVLVLVPRALLMSRAHSERIDDEYHIDRGILFLNRTPGNNFFNDPPVGEALDILPLWLAKTWSVHPNGALRLWGHRFSPDQILAAIAVWKCLLFIPLLVVIYLWLTQLYGPRAGWLGVGALLVEPTITAHTPLPSLDVLGAEGIVIGCYFAWRYFSAPSLKRLAVAAVTCSLAMTLKHTAIILPIAVLLFGFMAWMVRPFFEVNSQQRGGSKARCGFAICFSVVHWGC